VVLILLIMHVFGLVLLFVVYLYSYATYRSWRRTFYPISLSAVRVVAARRNLPFTLRPGLSHEREDTAQGNF